MFFLINGFRDMLFNFPKPASFPESLSILMSNKILLLLENIFFKISVFGKKFRLVFRLVCSLTSWAFHVLCECSMQQLWSVVVLCCVGMSWSCMVLLRSSLTILIFGLVSLSITEKILKSPIMVVSLSVFLVL